MGVLLPDVRGRRVTPWTVPGHRLSAPETPLWARVAPQLPLAAPEPPPHGQNAPYARTRQCRTIRTMGALEDQQPDDDTAADSETCGECGHSDDTVRDLGLRLPYLVCDPCFDDLVATRTAAAVLPLSRILDDVLTGQDPPAAGRRSDTWRRTAPADDEPGPTAREDRPA